MALFGKKKQNKEFKYPGIRQIMSGNTAVIMCERESSDAAGAYLSSPTSEMSTMWNLEKSKGHLNISNRPLISINPEDNASASAVTTGLALSGLRATHFNSSAQSVASLHESLYASVGKRLPYVLNIACKAITKATSNNHCGHDDYHSMDDTGFIQLFARNNQSAADLNIISRKIAELSLNPAAVAQDGFLTSHLIEPLNLPERELIEEFVDAYHRSAQNLAAEIRSALATQDWKGASAGAHKLKSSSRSLGALALGDVCAQLEKAGNDGNAEIMSSLAVEFENILAAVIDAINQGKR